MQFEVPVSLGHYGDAELMASKGFAVGLAPTEWLFDFNLTWWTLLMAVYITVDLRVGLFASFCSFNWILVNRYLIEMDSGPQPIFNGNLTSMLIGLQVFAWLTQFIGHGIYERRAPALVTNLLFMFLGPFFVFFEILNLTFDYKSI